MTVFRDIEAKNAPYGGAFRSVRLKESRHFEETIATAGRTQAAFLQT
jgi:hypothetical protein